MYRYMHQRFFAKSDAKITTGIFTGTDICKKINEERFGKRLGSPEKEAMYQICLVVKIFLGNKSSS